MNTQSLATLPPETRAAQLLSFDETKAELTALAKSSERITQITNKAGREECHSSLMLLKSRRQAEAQRKLDEQAEQLRKEKAAAAKKAEADRLANLGLREAAQAVVDFAANHYDDEQVFVDLRAALANDENRTARAVTVNRSKKAVA